jgi:hypothetical protein
MQSNALIYCSIWPDWIPKATLEEQSAELQTYCLLRGMEVGGIFHDHENESAPSEWRVGLRTVWERLQSSEEKHLVLHSPDNLSRNPDTFLALTKVFLQAGITVHVASWSKALDAKDGLGWLHAMGSLIEWKQGIQVASSIPTDGFSTGRKKPIWARIFGLLQDERYAEGLLQALFKAKSKIRMTDRESHAVHSGYDHLHMFRALGFRIKGEDTDNTRIVADVVSRHWKAIRPHIEGSLAGTVEDFETGTVP